MVVLLGSGQTAGHGILGRLILLAMAGRLPQLMSPIVAGF
ncbi:hypothetical protein DCCM_3751 [Desulfocucumis palustris]|uniref:Uncharacterized protein n=1 Tax=Desulfocucumis palustris TaxID=1898651 RepID=A0A2L2XL21_9FIRM|nr:hypothetical protein DCCM_3751 [Desulfocucumis palustris]